MTPSEHAPKAPADRTPLHAPSGSLPALSLAALGVVFGDIGTSPLYTLPQCMTADGGSSPTPADILGVLSLIVWSLTLVVTVKYLSFIMRADNRGEGGILALLALIPDRLRTAKSGRIGWSGGARHHRRRFLYGDGIITPAISVLSAIEGLEVPAPQLQPIVLPLTCAVLVGLFAIQRRGTGSVGLLFGPVMAVWFLTIGGLGVFQIVRHPAVLVALNPVHAVLFFVAHGARGVSSSGRSSSRSPGARRSTRTWGTSGPRPIRVAWLMRCHAVARPQLLRSRGADARGRQRARQTVLRHGPSRPVDVCARRSLRRCHRHRLPSPHLRGVFAHPPSRAARLQPPRDDSAHLEGGRRANLRSGGQLGARHRVHRARPRVQGVEPARRRVRDRRHRDDGDHVDRLLRSHAHDVEVAALAVHPAPRLLPLVRHPVLRREPLQVLRRPGTSTCSRGQ